MSAQSITIKSRLAFLILASTACLLLAAFAGGMALKYGLGYSYAKGLITLFHVDGEANIPTIFSALQLFLASMILVFIFLIERSRQSNFVAHWFILALGFFYLAIDEATQIHEQFRAFDMAYTWITETMGVQVPIWVLSGVVLVTLVGIYYLRFLASLDISSRINFLLAGSFFLLGAVAMEVAGRHCYRTAGCENLTYDLLVFIEEGLEMLAISYFIFALLRYCSFNYSQVQLNFK